MPQGHLKIDIGFFHCMSDPKLGIKTQNRVGGGKYEMAMTLTADITSGKPVLKSTITDQLQVDNHISIMKGLVKRIAGGHSPNFRATFWFIRK